jgi:hypothetical protein
LGLELVRRCTAHSMDPAASRAALAYAVPQSNTHSLHGTDGLSCAHARHTLAHASFISRTHDTTHALAYTSFIYVAIACVEVRRGLRDVVDVARSRASASEHARSRPRERGSVGALHAETAARGSRHCGHWPLERGGRGNATVRGDASAWTGARVSVSH